MYVKTARYDRKPNNLIKTSYMYSNLFCICTYIIASGYISNFPFRE